MKTVIATKTVDANVYLNDEGHIAQTSKAIAKRVHVKITKGQVFGEDEDSVNEANEVRRIRGEAQNVQKFPYPESVRDEFLTRRVLHPGDELPREGAPVTIGDVRADKTTEAGSVIETGGAIGSQMQKGQAPQGKADDSINDL